MLEPTTDEPLLVACADIAVETRGPRDDFAPGLLETAAAARALRLPHVAALDARWCRLLGGDVDVEREAPADAEIVMRVEGASGLRVAATRTAVVGAVQRFAAARLQLAALDAAPCALLNVAIHLARVSHGESAAEGFDEADLDPLAAVSVAPECESDASRAGRALAVPVGLALGRFGLIAHA